jgi:hypothetical protein
MKACNVSLVTEKDSAAKRVPMQVFGWVVASTEVAIG